MLGRATQHKGCRAGTALRESYATNIDIDIDIDDLLSATGFARPIAGGDAMLTSLSAKKCLTRSIAGPGARGRPLLEKGCDS